MNNPGYVDSSYLARLAQITMPVKIRSYEYMHLAPGQIVLDVGCGPGTDTLPLFKQVGPTGQVVGVDYDPAMIREADRRAAEAGFQERVRHTCATVPPIPFPDGTFDAVRCERVLQHIHNPELVLAEMVRVTRPGGWVVVADTDHSSLSLDCPDAQLLDIEWRMRRSRVELFNNALSGRTLYRLFKQAGLCDITFELFSNAFTNRQEVRYLAMLDQVEQFALEKGILSEGEIQTVNAMFEQADKEGIFFGYIILMLVAGRVA